MDTRFLIIEHDSGQPPRMRLADESQVSSYIDLADCHDATGRLLYLTDRGELVPVTLGTMERVQGGEEAPVVFAYSPLLADGQVMGQVSHTDH